MKNRAFSIVLTVIVFLFYLFLLVVSICLRMYDVTLLFLAILIFLIMFYKFTRYRYIKYGVKKLGYICYYNDYSSGYGKYGNYTYSIPEVDIMVIDDNHEKMISSNNFFNQPFFKGLNSTRFLELSSSNKKIYVDVYYIGDKYYVDFDSVRID